MKENKAIKSGLFAITPYCFHCLVPSDDSHTQQYKNVPIEMRHVCAASCLCQCHFGRGRRLAPIYVQMCVFKKPRSWVLFRLERKMNENISLKMAEGLPLITYAIFYVLFGPPT